MTLVYKEQGEGAIYAIDKKNIWVLTNDGSCAASKKNCRVGCGSCGTRKSERRFSVAVENPDAYTIGEKIRFRRFVPEPNLAGFLVFGTPILLALISILCWLLAAPQKVESAPALLSAAGAFFCGCFILMIIDTLFKKHYPATITTGKYPDNISGCSSKHTGNSQHSKEQ
jgi:hypothetical protein